MSLVCSACGSTVGPNEPAPFRCPSAREDDDIDHVLVAKMEPGTSWSHDDDPNPFVRYRRLLFPYEVAAAHGLGDDAYIALVRNLDDRVAEVCGTGFRVTPIVDAEALAARIGLSPGALEVKDETQNVSGSHKARHLMNVLIFLQIAEVVGLRNRSSRDPLAIASCGNAALAAAILARAADWELDVFVPTWADQAMIELLEGFGARITVCVRSEGGTGDPTYLRLREAIAHGSIPFTCQGPDDGLAIEGGATIGFELADAWRAAGESVDHIVIQVGGGALASGIVQGFGMAHDLGALERIPAVHTAQTAGGHPLERAYECVVADLHTRGTGTSDSLAVTGALAEASVHRSAYMWPWETEPKSVATGILDDETYDWRAVVRGMLETGGTPVVVSEDTLREANDLATMTTEVDVDPTGSAGLAGAIELMRTGRIRADDRASVLFTGVRRVSELVPNIK